MVAVAGATVAAEEEGDWAKRLLLAVVVWCCREENRVSGGGDGGDSRIGGGGGGIRDAVGGRLDVGCVCADRSRGGANVAGGVGYMLLLWLLCSTVV